MRVGVDALNEGRTKVRSLDVGVFEVGVLDVEFKVGSLIEALKTALVCLGAGG